MVGMLRCTVGFSLVDQREISTPATEGKQLVKKLAQRRFAAMRLCQSQGRHWFIGPLYGPNPHFSPTVSDRVKRSWNG